MNHSNDPFKMSDLSKILHRDGYLYIVICIVATFVFSKINVHLGWISFLSTIGCGYFFRNPDRVTPIGENLIISPADGVICNITNVKPPQELNLGEDEMIRISIFLSVLDVHVNRIPIDGKVELLSYNPGKFLNASLDKASIHNERQSVVIKTNQGEKIVVVQIAGLIARRIVCDLSEGDEILAGQRYGIIKFGSRVDVYIPLDKKVNVARGQRVVGGETILADLSNDKDTYLRIENFITRN